MTNKRSEALQPGAARGRRSSVSNQRQSAAVAFGAALGPVVDLCLERGITSPEMERVLRAVFVDRAERLLSQDRSRARSANDLRIGLMIGVHRNFVREIRTTKPRVQLEKVQQRHRGAALLQAWASDWQFLTATGQPRDLPVRASEGESPSFEKLVRQYMSGVSTGTAIAELRRWGAIRLLPDEQVRLRSRTSRPLGMTEASIATLSEQVRDLTSTLLHNLKMPEDQRFCDGVPEVGIDVQRLALVKQMIAKRARHFLDALAAELNDEAMTSSRKAQKVKVGLTIYSYEKAPP